MLRKSLSGPHSTRRKEIVVTVAVDVENRGGDHAQMLEQRGRWPRLL